ncbi:sensor histidine kinase [Corynebacterium sp. zg254]|uniref:Sensor histidine kinase n=1 Tax=Corynebacterium zhongnanshanii TaxID=2768834 RepID=A0ABQ6VGA0_9CORY|nr:MULTISPECIES: sensor histidine kinase [Corynebacterium]KAB3523343.1 sensor histidine kinase [Corynebacterium zhongnanshanii]MCR5913534.1 sensor histidine kinase [Corynebacterium sp. zg254]
MVKKLDQAWVFLGHGLHVLVAALWVVAVLNDGLSAAAVVFAVLYATGMFMSPRWVWLLAVSAAWAWWLYAAPSAAFVAFALFFLVVRFLPIRWAIPCVFAVAAVAVVSLGVEKGWTLGGVIGPVTGSLVALGLGIGFRMLRRETATAERARLAGEIHDTVAQGLVSIQMLLHSVEQKIDRQWGEVPEDLRRDLQLARQTAQANLEDTRRIIAELQPAQLEGADLPTAVRSVVASTPMGERMRCTIDGDARPLAARIEVEIVRITQSLVSNVVKHSHADAAAVTLTYQPDAVRVDVVDNGCGFQPDDARLSPVGLGAVKRKVTTMGGTMDIESEPGHGCGVSIEVPA